MSLLRDHDFRRLFLADVASQAGSQLLVLALPLVAVSALRASAFEVGLLAACQTLAFVVIGLPAGALVDRLRKRVVMVVSDWARALALASVPVAWWLDVLTIHQLYAVALALGVFTVFFDVAYQSYLPSLVERERLVEGNSTLEIVRTVAQVGGPSGGGYLIHLLTAPFALAATAAGFAWSALCLGTIRRHEPRQEPSRAGLGREIAEGVRLVLGHRLLRRIAACTATANFFVSVAQPMVLLLLARELGLDAGAIGLLMASGGLGGIVGALVNARVVRWLGQGPAMWLGIAVPAPLTFVLPWMAADWRLGLFVIYEFCVGAGVVIYNVTQLSFRQAITPDPLLGRVNATMRFLVWGTLPLGGLLGGALGGAIGVRHTLLVAAAGACLAFLPLVTSPLRSMRELPVSSHTLR
ncbi:MFS transporter [Nonomuraea angiospora]|uniref:MFS family permease n=1 Tax=Nonomuraea angiospora TaxID=46172 RepID=A0ABR9LZ30_9ACTN|nr:MFS transporter [Nonomuraea angiospora]MBE1585899.1 MFS family permease [Nonomuraea angiospora]